MNFATVFGSWASLIPKSPGGEYRSIPTYLGSMADKEVSAINDGFDMICLCQRSKSDPAEEGDVR